MSRLIQISALMLLFGTCLSACEKSKFAWNEEVRLQAGDTLVVRRTIKFKEYQPIGGGGGGSDIPESTLEVVAPPLPEGSLRWSYPTLLPMILDRDPDTKEWFIVATFYMCTAWRNLGRPKLPYAEFRYRGGQWVRQPLSEKFIGRKANVLVPNQADVQKDHTLESKLGIMSRPTISPRHSIVVSEWKSNC